MNRIVLVGRLESTPELRYTSTGIPVANFSLSVRRSIPNGQGRYERDIFRVVTWRKLAETCCKFLDRGRMIAVDGKLQNRIMSTPNGEKRIVVEVHADDVRFLEGARPRGEGQESEERASAPETETESGNGVAEEMAEAQTAPVVAEATANGDYDLDTGGWVPEDDGTLLDPGV
jgi:single-strand DNA-binding protein